MAVSLTWQWAHSVFRNKPVSRTRKNGALRAGVFRRRLFLRGIFLEKSSFFLQSINTVNNQYRKAKRGGGGRPVSRGCAREPPTARILLARQQANLPAEQGGLGHEPLHLLHPAAYCSAWITTLSFLKGCSDSHPALAAYADITVSTSVLVPIR